MEGTIFVRCSNCGWVGPAYMRDFNEEYPDSPQCPACGKEGCFDDVTKDSDFTQEQLSILLYDSLTEIKADDAGNIEEEFLGFPAGTSVKTIEDWFNKRIDGEIEELRTIINRFNTWYVDLINF